MNGTGTAALAAEERTVPGTAEALDGLAAHARALRFSINVNMWELARVFCEAKELLPHGEFGKWVEENADVSERTAQDMMAAYRRFGGIPRFAGLEKSKAFRLLPLPEGSEERFLAEHDVSAMTSREIREAVKKAREEARTEIERERAARMAAERRAAEAESREAVPDEMMAELNAAKAVVERQQAEIERAKAMCTDGLEERMRLAQENNALRRDIAERDDMLSAQQADLDRAQAELLDAKSAAARGDAERVPADRLTGAAFAQAVRSFIGTCARLPQMRMAFASMPHDERQEYDELLSTVERWCRDSRRAMNTVGSDGEVIA